MSTALGLIFVVLLIAANGFFVAVEFALVASDRSKIEARAADGGWASKAALGALKRLSFHLSGAQLGITVSSLVLGALAEPLVARLIDPLVEPIVGRAESGVSVALALLLATVFQMVAGELIPKNIAIAKPEATAAAVAPAARVVHGAFSPIIRLFNGAANWAVRRMGIEPHEELTSVRSLEEIGYLIRSSGETGSIDPEAIGLLERTIRFGDKTAADALVPRVHVTALPADAAVGDLVELAVASGHSRYPVFGEDLDDIVGVVSVTDVFTLSPQDRATTPITTIGREPNVVPETRDLVDLLDDFRESDTELFVVVDEHGGTAGIVTLEDVLEEITGDVGDEFDVDIPLTVGGRAGVTVVAGTLHGDEVEEASGFEMPEGDYETIAGFVLDQLGRIPAEGDDFVFKGWRFDVISMDGLRIASVQLSELES